MKDPESLPDLLDPVNDFFWSNNLYETEALQEASTRLQKILDAKYAPADLNAVVQACRHLSDDKKNPSCMLYYRNTSIFLMALWEHGIINPIISNLKKVLNLTIVGPFLFQKFTSTLLKSNWIDLSN